MRLSDAVMCGRTLIQLDPGMYLDWDCQNGCVIGMGLAAVGGRIVISEFNKLSGRESALRFWPWLEGRYEVEISKMAREVAAGAKTLDQVVDHIRSVEPPEYEEDYQISELESVPCQTV